MAVTNIILSTSANVAKTLATIPAGKQRARAMVRLLSALINGEVPGAGPTTLQIGTGGVRASGTLTVASNPANAATVTVAGTVFTFATGGAVYNLSHADALQIKAGTILSQSPSPNATIASVDTTANTVTLTKVGALANGTVKTSLPVTINSATLSTDGLTATVVLSGAPGVTAVGQTLTCASGAKGTVTALNTATLTVTMSPPGPGSSSAQFVAGDAQLRYAIAVKANVTTTPLVGSTTTATAGFLAAAINATTVGVRASASSNVVTVTANPSGTAGNSITLATSSGAVTVSAATLAGGTNATSVTVSTLG